MANKTILVTYSLPTRIVDLLCDHLNTMNVSQAVNKGLMGFLSNSSYGKTMNDFALHQITTIEDRRNVEQHSVRIVGELKQLLDNYSVVDTQYNVPTIMLANFLYYSGAVSAIDDLPEVNMISLPTEIEVDESLQLVGLIGNKWNSSMQYAIKHIKETSDKSWGTCVEVFAGALGIFSNMRFAFREIINDIDLWKINLYNAIKEAKDKVLIEMRAKSPNKVTFEKIKDSMKENYELDTKKINKQAAIAYLYTNLLSAYNKGDSYKKMSAQNYNKRVDAIYPLAERLKDAKLCGLHAFDIIKKYKKDKDVVFVVDPPYLDTSGYEKEIVIDKKYEEEKKKFGYAEHRELAKLLREIHQKYGNDFIYFCRITITRKKNQKTKEITNLAELETGDRHMQGKIDDLYWGYGFYYIDVPYSNDGTIERIITSFDFDGAVEYGGNNTSGAGQEVES